MKVVVSSIMLIGLVVSNVSAQEQKPQDDEARRLNLACPEVETDPLAKQIDGRLRSRDMKDSGDPRKDGQKMCDVSADFIAMGRRVQEVLRSCLPSTEPLVQENIFKMQQVVQFWQQNRAPLGCKN